MSESDHEGSSDIESEEENPPMKSVSAERNHEIDEVTDDDSFAGDDDEDERLRSCSRRKDHKRLPGEHEDARPSLPQRGKSFDEKDGEGSMSRSLKPRNLGSEPTQSDDGVGKRTKPKRRGTKSEVIDDDTEIGAGSFHRLAKDADKELRSGSKHKSRRSNETSARRRASKDQVIEATDPSDDDIDDFGEEEHEVELKGDGYEGGDSAGGRPRSHSNGRRPQNPSSVAKRGQLMRRTSSERFRRAVDGDPNEEDYDHGQSLSRSAHGTARRRGGSSDSLGSGSYHGISERTRQMRTPNVRPPRRSSRTPKSDGSVGSYDHDVNLSGRSNRTLDSIEDLEDFENIDFQTPGMANYDAEILELMQRANPERTTQIQRRVGRRREAVNYDRNMPMMTRQALMTRTASTQVQRQYVDGDSLDKRNMLVRSMSNSSMSTEEIPMSQHRHQGTRALPARRPPPRTSSSGMALSISEHPAPDDKRRLFRTRSSTSSFRQNQKPNRVQPISRRTGEMDNSRSSHGVPDDRNGSLSRAKSMHATVGRPAPSPKKPQRRVPKTEPKSSNVSTEEKSPPKDDSSMSEDSDVESDDDGLAVDTPTRKVATVVKPTPKPIMPVRKKTDKGDFTVKRNRAKLHSILYESKMGVDMHDLLETVRQGEVLRSPWKALMMPSP